MKKSNFFTLLYITFIIIISWYTFIIIISCVVIFLYLYYYMDITIDISIKSRMLDIVLSGNLIREYDAKKLINQMCNKSSIIITENIKNKLVDAYFNYYLCCYKQLRENKTRKYNILEKYFYHMLKNEGVAMGEFTQICKFVCIHGIIDTECIDCYNNSADICIHIRKKDRCILCDGSAFCVHFCMPEECVRCSPLKLCQNDNCRMILSDYVNKKCMF